MPVQARVLVAGSSGLVRVCRRRARLPRGVGASEPRMRRVDRIGAARESAAAGAGERFRAPGRAARARDDRATAVDEGRREGARGWHVAAHVGVRTRCARRAAVT